MMTPEALGAPGRGVPSGQWMSHSPYLRQATWSACPVAAARACRRVRAPGCEARRDEP